VKPFIKAGALFRPFLFSAFYELGNEIPDKRPHSERYFSWTAGFAAAG
jgi:hypothetical protein